MDKKKQLKNIDEPTIKDVRKLCIDNDICFRCYDINHTLVSSNIVKNTKRKRKALNIVAWNNHIYPMKNS